jgi:hypothetical protein
MIDKRRCPFPENRYFFLDQFLVVIGSLRSVPPDVILNAKKNIAWLAVQNNNGMDHVQERHE